MRISTYDNQTYIQKHKNNRNLKQIDNDNDDTKT